jgi:hypothetical protein
MDATSDPTLPPPAPAVTAGAGAPPPADAATAAFDSLNRPFDPEKFLRKFDTQGRWVNARSGRKPTGGTPSDQQPPDFSDVLAAAREGDANKITEIAESATAETLIGIIQAALVLIGEDEGVLSEQEKTLLSRPLNRVLEKYGVGKDALPAELELGVAISIIVIARLKKPKTATTVAKIRGWFVGMWARKKGADLAKRVEREAADVPSAS